MKFKSTGAYLLRYKTQFQRDALQDIFKLQDAVNKKGKLVNPSAIDLEVFFNLVWTLAKTADPSIPPPMEWLDTFNEFPIGDILPEVQDMIISTMSATEQPKKK